MDYSLLLGIHNIDQALREREEAAKEAAGAAGISSAEEMQRIDQSRKEKIFLFDSNLQKFSIKFFSVHKKVQRQWTQAMSGMEAIQAEAAPVDLGDEYP